MSRRTGARSADQPNLQYLDRRSFLARASRVLIGVPAIGALSACSLSALDPRRPEPTPVATPEPAPSELTPIPVTTPSVPELTPSPEPTPTPEPVEQVLRIAGEIAEPVDFGLPEDVDCTGLLSVMSGLLRVDPGYRVEADWAASWEPLDDGDGWLFQIRENDDGWTSGEPVTARDFVVAWRRLLDPESEFAHAWLLYDIENARAVNTGELPVDQLGVEAIDDWTLQVRLERPRLSFPALAASTMLSPFAGPADREENGGCPASGAYELEERGDNAFRLVPHGGYWEFGQAETLERIELSLMEPADSLTAFRLQDADFIRIQPADVARVREDAVLGDSLRAGVPQRIICLVPQIDHPPFDSVEIRRALSKVIDRRRLEAIVEGRVRPADRLVPAGLFPDLDGASPELRAGFEMDEALELIEESPYGDPPTWPEFYLAVPSTDTFLEQVARDIAAQLNENLGITVRVPVLDPEDFEEGLEEGRFPLLWVDWLYRYADPACAYADLFGSWLNPNRRIAWEDSGYDELARLADSIPDLDGRAEAYARCEELLQDEGVYVPLVHPVEHYLIQPWVQDVPRDMRGRLVAPGPVFTRFAAGITIGQRS